MKWPWVSRDSAERMIAFHQADAASWKLELELALGRAAVDIAYERDKNAELTERLLSLKMAGAVEVPQPAGVAFHPGMEGQYKPDEMRELIHARAGSNYRMRNMMLSQLAADRAANVSDDAIRDAILNGVPSDGVPA